eukprot:gene27093-29864_t
MSTRIDSDFNRRQAERHRHRGPVRRLICRRTAKCDRFATPPFPTAAGLGAFAIDALGTPVEFESDGKARFIATINNLTNPSRTSERTNNQLQWRQAETNAELLALQRLDETSAQLQKQGNYLEALECMERGLTVGEMCNLLAMTYLQQEEFPMVLELLKKAEILTERDAAGRAATYNHL